MEEKINTILIKQKKRIVDESNNILEGKIIEINQYFLNKLENLNNL